MDEGDLELKNKKFYNQTGGWLLPAEFHRKPSEHCFGKFENNVGSKGKKMAIDKVVFNLSLKR